MDIPEPLHVDYQNDSPISIESIYPNWKSLCKLFFIFLLYNLIGAIAFGIFIADAKNLATPTVKSFLTLALYVVTMLLTIRYAIKKSKKQSSFPFNFSFNIIQGWLVPVVIITTLALVVGLEEVSNLIPMPVYMQKIFEKAFTKNAFSLVMAIVAAPIMEEILCRGIILKGLLKNYSPAIAIVVSAIFFGILHLNPWQAIPAFFGGLFLGWVFYKTQSVIPGMIIHATINSTASLFLFLPKYQQGFFKLLGMPHYMVLCVFAVIVFVGGCMVIQRKVLPMTD